jgi:acyl carrier protein
MTPPDIIQIILDAVDMANHAREEGEKIALSEDLELFGSSGNLDSMELVALLIDIEEALMDHDIQVSLSDERAMSQSQSPFRSVQTLAAYIGTLIATAETEA